MSKNSTAEVIGHSGIDLESEVEEQPFTFFVYGTLKQGLRNSDAWGAKPDDVSMGSVSGATLFNKLNSFPGMKLIDDQEQLVAGELWTFHWNDFPEVLKRIDQLEGYYPQSELESHYLRRKVKAWDAESEQLVEVWTYIYNQSTACLDELGFVEVEGFLFREWGIDPDDYDVEEKRWVEAEEYWSPR